MATWQPILEGASAEAARASITQIGEEIARHPLMTERTSVPRADLPGGLAGVALFYGYLATATDRPELWSRVETLLDRCIEIVASQNLPPALHGGFTGTAWAIHHLTELAGEDDDAVGEIDDAILAMLEAGPWNGDYDLILGLVGFAIYALDRLPRPAARAILERIADHFQDRHEATPEGVTWFTPPELMGPVQIEQHPDGFYNLGLAHGVPGVIGVLGPMVGAGIRPDVTRPLLEGAVRWLLAQRQDSPDCAFAYNAGQPGRSRLAWCYGDAGVAIALRRAAEAVEHDSWRETADEIARATLGRSDDAGVVDAGLCHGSTGLALIYQRFHQATGDERFRAAARRWIEYTLDHRREDGVAGYPSRMPEGDGFRWEDDPGFLTGAAGVGLGLLAATSSLEPHWDRSLLVTVRG